MSEPTEEEVVQIGSLPEAETPWDSQCYSCAHFDRDSSPDFRCRAFPEGIPTALLYNRADHRQPFAGDRGLRFDGYEGDESPFAAYERYDARQRAKAEAE